MNKTDKKVIWFFNHYAQGNDLPGGTRHFDLGVELVKLGYEVTIFASGFHHGLLKNVVIYNNDRCFIEMKNGVKFIWVKTFSYNVNNWRRIINIISYAYVLSKIVPKLKLDKPDYVIGSTVHPFAPIIAAKLAKKYNSKFIFEIRDLWPQTFIDMGLWKEKGFISKIFKAIEKKSVNQSDKIIILSPLTIEYLCKAYNYCKTNMLLLPNGINKKVLNYKENFNSNGVFKIIYLGGVDSVHGLDFLINLANEIKEGVEFHIYGEGKVKNRLINESRKLKLDIVNWHSGVPKLGVPNVLAKADMLFVSTSNVLYGSENKLFDYMASGKPIISAVSGDHNNPVNEIKCGITLDRSDVKKSKDQLLKYIKENSVNFKEIGKRGQEYVERYRTTDILTLKLVEFLKQ